MTEPPDLTDDEVSDDLISTPTWPTQELERRISEYAEQIVAAAEPMTPEQRARVVELLRPVAVRCSQSGGPDAA